MAFKTVGESVVERLDGRINFSSLLLQLDPFESSDPFSSSSISSKSSGERDLKLLSSWPHLTPQ